MNEKSISRGMHDWLRHPAIFVLFQGFAKYDYLHFVFAKVSKSCQELANLSEYNVKGLQMPV